MAFDDEKQKLNNRLLAVCTADVIDYSLAEELLKQGAEPLGEVDDCGEPELVYNQVLMNFMDMENPPEDFYLITELFLRYGMDLSNPAVPYDYVLHPMWAFSCYSKGDVVLQTLKLLLDNGLKAEDAAAFWMNEVSDFVNVSGSLLDDYSFELFFDYIRKLMLIASYPHILKADKDLRKEIWYDYNCRDYDVTRFRNWNEFDFDIDTSHCERIPEVYKSIVTIKEKETGNPVWTFGVCLAPEEISH